MGNSFCEAVGARVRELRLARCLSQQVLAERVGLEKVYVGRVERGAQNLSLKSIAFLALALRVRPAALFAGISVTPDIVDLEAPAWPAGEGIPTRRLASGTRSGPTPE